MYPLVEDSGWNSMPVSQIFGGREIGKEIGKDEAHTEYVSVHLRMKWYLIKDTTDMM